MLLWENIVLALHSLQTNKMRALLTMLGIIIGIGAVISIFTVGNSLTLFVSEMMQELGANDVYVMVGAKSEDTTKSAIDGVKYGSLNSSELTAEDYINKEMIDEMCNKFPDEIYAVAVQHQLTDTAELSYGIKKSNAYIMGTSVGFFITSPLDLAAGKMFSQKDFEERKRVAIIPDSMAESLFGENYQKFVGSEVELNVGSKTENFTIIGVYEYNTTGMTNMTSMMSMMGGGIIYVPLKTAFELDNSEEIYNNLHIITKVGVDSDELAQKLSAFFKSYYRNNTNAQVTSFTIKSMVSMLTSMLSTLTLAISIVASIALLVGGIGVMNIMLVSVTERTREVGTRKALGAKNSSIRTQFIVEATIICIIGGALGIVLGLIGGAVASNAIGYPAQPSISGIIISIVFSISIGIFFGYYPANKAAKMNPIDALRYE